MFTIAHVNPNIAGKGEGEDNTQLFSWNWPGDDASIHPIVTSIVDGTILSILNTSIASLLHPSWKLQVHWGWREEHIGEGGLYARDVTPIFDNNGAARWVKAAMKLNSTMRVCIVYCGQHAYGTGGAWTPTRGGRSYIPLDDLIPHAAKDTIDDVMVESDDDAETRSLNPCNFWMTNPGFHNLERKLQKRILRQQQFFEVIRNHALRLLAYYEQSIRADEDMALLCEHDDIMNPPAAGSLGNR